MTYWPNKQSIDLNLAVANLFTQTYNKFFFSLQNRTKSYIPIDFLNINTRKKLLLEILTELEILILDLIEINLDIKQIKQLNNQIIFHFIIETTKKFLYLLNIKQKINRIDFCLKYNKLFFFEHSYAFHKLLVYLIFGSNNIDNNDFYFCKTRTPFYHVKALFENLVIQMSNIVTFNILESNTPIYKVNNFIKSDHFYHSQNKSIREISKFRNNIASYNLVNLYIYYPQNIYCNKYQTWLFSSKGIIYKYIYFNRTFYYTKLSNLQLSSILYLEIQDFTLPRINNFIVLIGKLIIYILIEVISQSANICANKIINRFYTKKY